MATQVILLEKVDHLGSMGEVVNVKPGYARNFLLPQNKALRATKENIAYFEAQKSAIEKVNNEKKSVAAVSAKKVDGLKIAIIRQASEGGQLFGSVSSRDIADAVSEASGEAVQRNQVVMNTAFKTIGLFPVTIALHAEVKVEVVVNIARTTEEAATQAKTGKALIANAPGAQKEVADTRADFMDEDAFAAEQAAEADEAAEAAEFDAKSKEKSAKRAAKKADAADEAGADEEPTETTLG